MGTSKKIGLISDTHIPTRAKELPAEVFEIFADVDYIIHAGDYVDFSVIEELQKLAPVTGCYGNMDSAVIKKRLPKIAALEFDEKVIKVIHNLRGLFNIKELQDSSRLVAIIHGHTHKISVEKSRNLLIINPGSATHAFSRATSIGLLYIVSDNVDYELIELK